MLTSCLHDAISVCVGLDKLYHSNELHLFCFTFRNVAPRTIRIVPVAHGVFLLLAALQGHLLIWIELRGYGGGRPGGSPFFPSLHPPALSFSLSLPPIPSLTFFSSPPVFLGSPWFLIQATWTEFHQCGRL